MSKWEIILGDVVMPVLCLMVVCGLVVGLWYTAASPQQRHRQGVIDATTGAWKAKFDEDTQQWLVWEVKE